MKFPQPIPVRVLAERFGAQLIGDDTLYAHGINEIHRVEPGDIAFADVPKYFQKTLESPVFYHFAQRADAMSTRKGNLGRKRSFRRLRFISSRA